MFMGFSVDDIARAISLARHSTENDGDINDAVRFMLLRRSAITRSIFAILKQNQEDNRRHVRRLFLRELPIEVAVPEGAVVTLVQFLMILVMMFIYVSHGLHTAAVAVERLLFLIYHLIYLTGIFNGHQLVHFSSRFFFSSTNSTRLKYDSVLGLATRQQVSDSFSCLTIVVC